MRAVREVVSKYQARMKKRNYQNTIWLCFSTIMYGTSFFFYPENAINRISFFGGKLYIYIGLYMVFWSILKLISIYFVWKRMKKIALIAVLSSWLLVFWVYFNSPWTNNSWIMALAMIGFCYIALFRGDFTED